MESHYLVYSSPAEVNGDPIGKVVAGSPVEALHKIARIIKLGYSLRIVRA